LQSFSSNNSDAKPNVFPMSQTFIPYGRQDISEADIEAVVAVLQSDYLTQGPRVPDFEKACAALVGSPHAVAMNSATSALHVACLALGLGPGDLLWTSPITFVASANCARYCGADVDFVDIDADTYNLSVAALEAKLEHAERVGRLPNIVVAVDFAGQPCDLARVGALSRRFGFKIIEDASHAIGASLRGERVGSGASADVTIFSFHPVKIVTTAEGGMALTSNAELATRMAELRSHGITRDVTRMRGGSDGPWYYQQTELGLNYRLTDLQAALGMSQITRLDEFVTRRGELAARYDTMLGNLPVTTPQQIPESKSSWHLYVICVPADDRRRVFEGMRQAGIGVNVHYIPVHLQPYYQDLGFSLGDFPVSENYYRKAITLPLHPGMTEADQNRVVAVLKRLIE
jgi:UDP-4-amino-4,6-dideoxy-N-acetyl-beta-L-altrosamine transaminase